MYESQKEGRLKVVNVIVIITSKVGYILRNVSIYNYNVVFHVDIHMPSG